MKRVLVVVGTRPEAIKLAPVVHALRQMAGFEVEVCATGQHREMLAQALNHFGCEVQWDLDLMRPDQTVVDLTTRAIGALSSLFAQRCPDAVVVQGDTNSTFAGALAAYYNQIPVAHVEAGLRTDDLYSPYPEEANRRLVTQLSSWHFAPTVQAEANLLREGVDPDAIVVTGNTAIDALLYTLKHHAHVPLHLPLLSGGTLVPSQWEGRRLLLATIHRRENHGAPLLSVCRAIRTLADTFDDAFVVVPVHPNPNVQTVVQAQLGDCPHVALAQPLEYGTFCRLMAHAHLILSDSGGIQEEAPSVNVPVLVLRANTERPEGLAAGTALLVGTEEAHVVREIQRLWNDPHAYERIASAPNPYGDGHAAERISAVLQTALLAPEEAPVSSAAC